MEATESIRQVLSQIEVDRRKWERILQEREIWIIRRIEKSQIIIERNQISNDLELLYKEVEHRKANLGSTIEHIQRSITAFHDISENMNVNYYYSMIV